MRVSTGACLEGGTSLRQFRGNARPFLSPAGGAAGRKQKTLLRSTRQQLEAAARNVQPSSAVEANRRDALLLGAGGLLAAAVPWTTASAAHAEGTNKRVIEVKYLTALQKNAQKSQVQTAFSGEIAKVVTGKDAVATLRLALHDAATYNIQDGTGGPNGSIVLGGELSRPQNEGLKPIVDKLKVAKEAIDAQNAAIGREPISWADLVVLAAKVAAAKSWATEKIEKSGIKGSGEVISSAFGASFPVNLGRIDATKPDPPVNIPGMDASVDEITEFMNKLGNSNPGASGFLTPKAPFWERPTFVLWTAAQFDPAAAEAKLAADPRYKEFKEKYDKSRKTVTRTDYEVDFIDYFSKLVSTKVGAKFNPDAYLIPITVDIPKL